MINSFYKKGTKNNNEISFFFVKIACLIIYIFYNNILQSFKNIEEYCLKKKQSKKDFLN